MALSPLLQGYDHVLLDLDGCVYVGDRCTPGAPGAVSALRAAGKTVAFLTNDARRSPEEYVRKLWSLGLQASLEEVVTAGAVLQYVLAGRGARHRAYVIGSPATFRHVSESGHRVINGTPGGHEAELVVIAAHDGLSFDELAQATQAVMAGAEMLAASRDRTIPTEDGPWPATGAIVAALEYATCKSARAVGKPAPDMFAAALDRLEEGRPGSVGERRTLVVGDSLESDLAGAAGAGLDAAIVLTGATTPAQADAAHDPSPVAIAPDLRSLLLGS